MGSRSEIKCIICNGKIKLLNGHFLKQIPDGYLCGECYKRLGGSSTIHDSKITYEELMALNSNVNEQIAERAEIIANTPLQTAEGMYNYCVENGYADGVNKKWGIRNFSIIESQLLQNEKVLMAFTGLNNYSSITKNDGDFAYAVTNKRIIMVQKNTLSSENSHAIYLKNINDITFTSGIAVGILTINTNTNNLSIGFNKTVGKNIHSAIHEFLDNLNLSNTSNTISYDSSAASIADDIMEYKQLLDDGAITQEEYDAKKRQLLGL